MIIKTTCQIVLRRFFVDYIEDMAHCKLCNTNFSVTAGALYDVKRHAKSSTHVTAVEASSQTKSITNFVDKKSSSVILSETLFNNQQ
jgi:hypothetical protein